MLLNEIYTEEHEQIVTDHISKNILKIVDTNDR